MTRDEVARTLYRINMTDERKISEPYRKMWRDIVSLFDNGSYKELTEKQQNVILVNYERQNNKPSKKRKKFSADANTLLNKWYNAL